MKGGYIPEFVDFTGAENSVSYNVSLQDRFVLKKFSPI